MLLKSKHVLKKSSSYIDSLCRKKSLFPEDSFSTCIWLYIQEQKWEVLSLEVPTVQHPDYFTSAWMADPGSAFLNGHCMRSACAEVILNSSCQTASCVSWRSVHHAPTELLCNGTKSKTGIQAPMAETVLVTSWLLMLQDHDMKQDQHLKLKRMVDFRFVVFSKNLNCWN